jgi:hypothetical protein
MEVFIKVVNHSELIDLTCYSIFLIERENSFSYLKEWDIVAGYVVANGDVISYTDGVSKYRYTDVSYYKPITSLPELSSPVESINQSKGGVI